jgi:hypothetical protein
MTEARKFTLEEAHDHLAKMLNGKTWELLQATDRTKSEENLMIHVAHASCYHWLHAGTRVQHQRAEWLIARVYIELGMTDSALYHASYCLDLTHEFADLMEDFDWAYAYEGVARANALAGNRDESLKYLQQAESSGRTISEDEDRRQFTSDLSGGNWYGLR